MPEPTSARPRGPLVELTIARVLEFLREPEAVFWTFLFPILLAICLGLAFRDRPPDRIPIGVVDGPQSAARLAALERSPALLPRGYAAADGLQALERGKISLLVEGDAAKPVYRFDPTRPDARIARLEADDALQRTAGRADAFRATDEKVTERGSRYIDFVVPGILGMNVMMAMWGLGFSVVSARLKNLLKRLVATPMKKSHFLLSQILARLMFLPLEVGAILGFATLAFGVPVRGSRALLGGTCLVGVGAFSGIGLLIASRTRTIEGLSGLMNVVMLPMWLLSGVFFSSDRFPDAVQPVIKALPLTALIDTLRGVMLRGDTLGMVWGHLALLVAWGAVTFVLALRIFSWK